MSPLRPTATVVLRPKREKSVINHHPWIFSGGIGNIVGKPENGDLVTVTAGDGTFLGTGLYSPHSQIRVRILSFQEEEIDDRWFRNTIQRAAEFRKRIIDERQTNAWRAFYGESDGIPGLIIDRYANVLSCQFLNAALQRLKITLIGILGELFTPDAIVEHADPNSARMEKYEASKGLLAGRLENPVVVMKENGLDFAVDVLEGQKTGFFLDQRDNRQKVRSLADGKEILNCFSYSGGFSIYAVAGGAKHVVSVDSAEGALTLMKRNLTHSGQPAEKHELVKTDVFRYLLDNQDRKFDIVILDPPAFIKRKDQINQGAKGYQTINRSAMGMLKDDGLLFTFSCSHFMDQKLFKQILFASGVESGRNLQYLFEMGAGPDHPVGVYFTESHYLKGYCLRVY